MKRKSCGAAGKKTRHTMIVLPRTIGIDREPGGPEERAQVVMVMVPNYELTSKQTCNSRCT
ncbi:hypothetical protein IF2G_00290 [Cordyceps javanica]|nr:hypothetical protein IF2G_00290 [Cordyceps javanica]